MDCSARGEEKEMTNCLLKKDLIAHKIYSTWQFVEYTEKI